jgi:hypothetical protein
MTARLSLLAIAALVLIGCGASGSDVRRAQQEERGGPCPEGTRELRPRDVLPTTPQGTSIAQADPKDAERYVTPFKAALGERLKSVRTAVVLERGADFGTAVVVVNGTEKMGDPRDVLRGAQANAREGTRPREYTIAGRPGMISEESDGAIAAVAISDCAMVMLSGPDTPMVKRIAGRLEAQE